MAQGASDITLNNYHYPQKTSKSAIYNRIT